MEALISCILWMALENYLEHLENKQYRTDLNIYHLSILLLRKAEKPTSVSGSLEYFEVL